MRLTPLFISAAAAVIISVAGCAKKENAGASGAAASNEGAAKSADNSAPAPSANTPAAPKGEVRVLEISGNDTMKYDKTRLEANAGETIRLVLTNAGALPKNVMGHNWVLLKAGTNPDQFAIAAAQAMKTEYIPADKADVIIAHTKLIGPKEKVEITFEAPPPGEYPYVCTFPGHTQVGMKGVLVIK